MESLLAYRARDQVETLPPDSLLPRTTDHVDQTTSGPADPYGDYREDHPDGHTLL